MEKKVLKFNAYNQVNSGDVNENKLNESVSNLSFQTTITNNFSEYFLENSEYALKNNLTLDERDNYDVDNSHFVVDWKLDMDLRMWGIKDIDIHINNIKGIFTVNVWGEDDDTPFELQFDAEALGFSIKNEVELKNGTILPTSVEINFKDKTVVVY